MIIAKILVVLVLVLLNGFFAASEFAIERVRATQRGRTEADPGRA
jgi:CBS domain containing-hemolysin-like protein